MKNPIAIAIRKELRTAAWVGLPLLAAAALMLQPAPAVQALEAPVPAATGFAQPSLADVIERAQPAVVKIEVAKQATDVARLGGRPSPFGGGVPFEEFLRRFGQGGQGQMPGGNEPQPRVEGLGSGFIIDADGYIVTNHHVIEGADDIKVTLNDGRTLPAKLIGADTASDLALLKVAVDKPLPTLAFGDSDRARVGDWVVAIGNPFGLGGSVTAGIISARGRDIHSGPYDDFLQIDAPINSGNSGGPIIDASGRVVGVNTAIFSPNGGNIGIGFAIPARNAEQVVGELREHGAVTRGWLGVQIQPLTDDVAEALNVKPGEGTLVADVVGDGPARRAGLQAGDIVTRFNGTLIKEPRDLSRAVASAAPGEKVTLDVIRNGKSMRLSTVLDKNESAPLADNGAGDSGAHADDALGLALGPLSPDARASIGLDADVKGALVVGVKSGGPADTSGVQPGDIILRVNRKAIADVRSAQDALASAREKDTPVVVLLRRGDEQFFTTLKTA